MEEQNCYELILHFDGFDKTKYLDSDKYLTKTLENAIKKGCSRYTVNMVTKSEMENLDNEMDELTDISDDELLKLMGRRR